MAKKLSERLERIARGQVWGAGDHDTLDEAIELARRVEWQPIETAPKDGNEVILFDPDYLQRSGFEGRYSEPRGSWLSSYDGPVNPTHWMPLPEPPEV